MAPRGLRSSTLIPWQKPPRPQGSNRLGLKLSLFAAARCSGVIESASRYDALRQLFCINSVRGEVSVSASYRGRSAASSCSRSTRSSANFASVIIAPIRKPKDVPNVRPMKKVIICFPLVPTRLPVCPLGQSKEALAARDQAGCGQAPRNLSDCEDFPPAENRRRF